MSKVKVGEIEANPGEKTTGYLKPVQWYDSAFIIVPVAIVNGTKEGPVLWIQAASHGNEHQGTFALQNLYNQTDPKELAGTLILVPVLNDLGFRARERSSPVDGVDFNRSYPGAPVEKVMHLLGHTEVIVHTIVEEIKKNADYVIDLHDAGPDGLDMETIYNTNPDPEIARRARAMAFASGQHVIREVSMSKPEDRLKYPGTMRSAIIDIPCCTVEHGGGTAIEEEYVRNFLKALTNIMKHLKMIAGEPEISDQQIFLNATHFVRAHSGGMLRMKRTVFDRIHKGDALGIVTDLFGKEIETIRSPVDGVIYALRNCAVVCTGQWVVSMGTEAPKPQL